MKDSVQSDNLPVRHSADRPAFFTRVVDGPWIDWLILVTTVMVCFAVPLLSLRLVTDWNPFVQMLVALSFAVVTSVSMYWWARLIFGRIASFGERVGELPLWIILLLGLLLRAAWVLIFPAEPGSDGATYWNLAAKLASGGDYYTANTYAFWPVGYPLFLSVFFSFLGVSKFTLLVSNFLLYLLAFYGVTRLTQILGGDRAAKFAAVLFAIWPNMIASVGTPEKEMLVVALLPWIAALILQGVDRKYGVLPFGLAAVLLGFCILVQPSLQFLPIAFIVLIGVLVGAKRQAFLGVVVFVIAIATVLTPWVARNYKIFDTFVLVSTNGGDNLYRANNPLATGGYTKVGEVDLSGLGELERDRRGRELAVEWIRENPSAFTKLALEKQLRFTGDDAAGVYVTFKVGGASESVALYTLLKAVANFYWLLLWLCLGALTLHRIQTRAHLPLMARLPFWLWLYLFAIHSVFESTGKYHMPIAWVMCVLIAVYALSGRGVAGDRAKSA